MTREQRGAHIAFPAGLLARIDAAAERGGLSRSAWVVRASLAVLDQPQKGRASKPNANAGKCPEAVCGLLRGYHKAECPRAVPV